MSDVFRYFRLLLVALTLLHLGLTVRDTSLALASAKGLAFADGVSAIGGDFINMYSAAQLTLSGRAAEIYDLAAFQAFQRTMLDADIGIRMWAYPPTSLTLIAPLALLSFWPALILWSLLGLGVLAFGARRLGFDWLETFIIVLSPTAISSVYYGQTGNLAAGLLLIGVAAARDKGLLPALSAALLTVKPQLGFLLPALWLVRRQYRLLTMAVLLVALLAGLSLWLFGTGAWIDYVTKTLAALGGLERSGEGPFTTMIPSTFMAVRIVTGNADLAQWVHFGVAACIALFVTWQFIRSSDVQRQNAVLLVGTMLITPYAHIYDMAPVVAAALLLMRLWSNAPPVAQLLICFAVLAAWALPAITLAGNALGVPLGPPVLLILLALVALPVRGSQTQTIEERETT